MSENLRYSWCLRRIVTRTNKHIQPDIYITTYTNSFLCAKPKPLHISYAQIGFIYMGAGLLLCFALLCLPVLINTLNLMNYLVQSFKSVSHFTATISHQTFGTDLVRN